MGVALSSPVAGLDRTDCQILKQLNIGRPMPRPLQKNRIEKLLESGFIEKTDFGEMVITVRGQLELARWRFRHLQKSKIAFSGPRPREALFSRFFRSSAKTT